VNTSIGPAGAISGSIANFNPSSTGAILTQLGTMQSQLNDIGSSLASANSAINAGILVASLGNNNGVALNGPRG
jgi:hypothetical protein